MKTVVKETNLESNIEQFLVDCNYTKLNKNTYDNYCKWSLVKTSANDFETIAAEILNRIKTTNKCMSKSQLRVLVEEAVIASGKSSWSEKLADAFYAKHPEYSYNKINVVGYRTATALYYGYTMIKDATVVSTVASIASKVKKATTTTQNKYTLPEVSGNADYEVVTLKNLNVSQDRSEPIKTGKKIDELLSRKGGLMPATVNVFCGMPGAGKTALTIDILSSILQNNPKLTGVYIPTEMDADDLVEELEKTPTLGDVPVVIMAQYYRTMLFRDILVKELNKKHAIVLIDSIEDLVTKIAAQENLSKQKVEDWLINILLEYKELYGTAFIVIQQLNKSGEFVGKNSIKHNTTSFWWVMKEENTNARYVYFEKNRRNGGQENVNMFFNKDSKTGEVYFDENKFAQNNKVKELMEINNDKIITQQEAFEKIFGISAT